MAGTSFSTIAKSATNISLTDGNGYGLFGDCTGAPDTSAGLYQHGCIMVRSDTSTGTVAVYQNTGSVAVPVWTLFDTALPGDTATSLVDTNNVVVVGITTVASTVNGLLITGSATGAVSANAVTIAPGAASGSDSAISLQISPKGVTGLLTIGLATGTGTITLGSSSGAQTVAIGVGAGASTVTVGGGAAGSTVNLAVGNTTAVTDTVNIATGTSTTSGGKAVNIGTGVPGAGTTTVIAIGSGGTTTGTVGITIGSVGNAAHTTAIQGGSGATAITLTPQTTGGIVIGAAAGTGTITVGSSSTTQTLILGGGAGVATINVGTGAAANKITLGAAASLVSIFGTMKNPKVANYVAAGGSNNAITATLTDASGTNIPLAAGLGLIIANGALTLQAGANTLDFNGGGAVAIKKASAPTVDLAVARAANAIIYVIYNGTSWLEMSE
jgi:hypothetical protein